MKRIILSLMFLTISFTTWPQDSLNVMLYNLYRFPDNSPENREFILREIVKKTKPDLLMACEIISQEGAERILNTAFQHLPDSFSAPVFVYDPNMGDDPLQQMVYYNTRKLTLVFFDFIPTPVRQINHYLFYLNPESPPLVDTQFLDVFVTHLKAGTGNANAALRKIMIDSFVAYLPQIPRDHFILLSGDMNFYEDQEPAFLKITDSANPIIMTDPIHAPGNWHDNEDFKAIHTQATRLTVDGFGLGGASGGMDDRFDFIFISKNLAENNPVYYVPGSYQAIGNNGNCFNKAINDPDCMGQFDLPFRNLLFQMSDHTPVMMKLWVQGKFPGLGIRQDLSPNPQILFPGGNVVKKELMVKVEGIPIGTPVPFLIYDLTGREHFRRHLKISPDPIPLDVTQLNQGMYFIKIGQSVAKFIRY